MKPVLGIYVYYLGDNEQHWDEYSNNMGGSETWAIAMAREFAVRGFHVIVFGNPEFWHFTNEGIEYVPREMFRRRCEYQHFDYFISSRTVSELDSSFYCPHTYTMSHEANIMGAESYEDLKMNQVRKIACLSEWHADYLCSAYEGLTRDRTFITFNGIDQSLYLGSTISDKRNMMVWSSCIERGFKNFVENIFPEIKKKVPDFEVNVCTYSNSLGFDCNVEGINFLGRLTKKELADLQRQANIWVYPNYGLDPAFGGYPVHETFCITAVENAMAGNALICGASSGLRTTLNGYIGLFGDDIGLDPFCYKGMDEKLNRLNKMIAYESICALTRPEYMSLLSREAMSICQRYTWSNAADKWIEEFSKTN